MDIQKIFDNFCRTLERWTESALNRNQLGVLSEDTICHFLASTYVQAGVEVHKVEMEVPHPVLETNWGAQKDVDVRVLGEPDSHWIEVKLDKKIPSGKALNKTNRLGKLIEDLLRLSILGGGRAFVVYVTDDIIADYIEKTYAQFLTKGVFSIDERFLLGLPQAAVKEIDPSVRQRLGARSTTVRVTCLQEVSPWTCILYEVCRNLANSVD